MLLLLCESLAVAQSNSVAKPTDFNSFRIIPDRNIFNPSRFANRPGTYRPRTQARRRNSFFLAGTMSYGVGETPGSYAFFDGTSSEYRKATQRDDSIAGFKIAAISPNAVTLLLDTNQMVMKVGMQMRDDAQGHWTLGDSTALFARNSSADEPGRGNYSSRPRGFDGSNGVSAQPGEALFDNTDTNAVDNASQSDMTDQGAPSDSGPTDTVTLPAGPASDALLRLIQLRQQEEQQSGSGNQPRN